MRSNKRFILKQLPLILLSFAIVGCSDSDSDVSVVPVTDTNVLTTTQTAVALDGHKIAVEDMQMFGSAVRLSGTIVTSSAEDGTNTTVLESDNNTGTAVADSEYGSITLTNAKCYAESDTERTTPLTGTSLPTSHPFFDLCTTGITKVDTFQVVTTTTVNDDETTTDSYSLQIGAGSQPEVLNLTTKTSTKVVDGKATVTVTYTNASGKSFTMTYETIEATAVTGGA